MTRTDLWRRRAGAVCAAITLAWIPATNARAQYEDEETQALHAEIEVLAGMFASLTRFPWTEKDGEVAFLYGDTRGVVHHYVSDRGKLYEKWKSFPLEGTVKEIFAADLAGDGVPEIITYTTSARIYVWDVKDYQLLWESVEEKFEAIQAMAVADVDRDPALEIVVCADNKIAYYDGAEFFREKEGRDFIDPGAIRIADVDGDLIPEIIANDGYIIDASTLNIEWATDGFGYPMSLFDLDGDGVLEVVGELGGALKFWDIEDRRELW